MKRPTPKPSDGVAIVLALAVLGYHLLITAEPIQGVAIAIWILVLQSALRRGNDEQAAVVFGLGAFVLAGFLSGVVWLFFTNLIVAGFAYTIWTVKYAPERTSSA